MVKLTLNEIGEDQDVERETSLDDNEGLAVSKPYDPTLIRVEPKMFSLRNILDMIDEGEIDLAPDFQRLSVWSPKQKSRLIESVLLRIPLPAFYFASDAEGKLQVVDGVQRLSTIHEFVRSERSFKLVDLEYLSKEVGIKRFFDIKGTVWAKRINGTQIIANVIDPQTPTPVKFDIFKRINTGGTPLNSQEIRHCMSKAPSRSLLKQITSTQDFQIATGYSLVGNVRMADREMALRVLAFSMFGVDRYYRVSGLDEFLNDASAYLDNVAGADYIKSFEYHFNRAMSVAYDIFGEYAFRKWPLGEERRYPINRAIFEAVGTTLVMNGENALKPHSQIKKAFRELCTHDAEFISHVTQSTASAVSVAGRFQKIREVILA
ncbi:DUF262 domain-containing protein [Xanthomonas arboricola]|uniref:DUF262 domain-containing protein n=1 Tax=Xanthomonas arboricola TaxID=56448 RepID=UPI0016130A27|nr:DUF262 domain-containing protein [Xanthomonas arboricola]MBB5859017.1 hypothetical protein [Xanthomonas arboricola]